MIKIYSAQWLVPVSTPPVECGAVAVDGARIVGVGTKDEVINRFPAAEREDFGAAAITPGFVNAHSHLELTAMRGFLEREEGDFFAWLMRLTVARRDHLTAEDLRDAATWGAVEAARAGVTCLGDAAYEGAAPLAALKAVGLRGIVFQETINPDPAQADAEFEKLRAAVARLRAGETELARVGVSPHAPYSVSPELIELTSGFAESEGLPVMIHAAESEAEDQLIRDGRGIFALGFPARGIEWRAAGVSPVGHLARLGLLGPRVLLAHCVRVSDEDIETIRASGAAVAHCPKSNAKLGHGRAPYEKFSSLRLGLGSDSVASNNTCDMLEEARFALLAARAATGSERLGELTAERALRDATTGGADALGLADCGALAEGKAADLAVVRLDGAHQSPAHDPVRALIFSSSGRDVTLTVVGGREVYRDARVQGVDEERLGARMREVREKLAGA